MTLNIRQGNGAVVVVGARESLAHGEGQQIVQLIKIGGMRNAKR